MKKLFTLLTLALLSIGTAWAEDETILSFSAGTLTGATATYGGSGSLDTDKYKFGNSDNSASTNYVELTLSSGTFQTGDKISISYYASNTSKTVNPGLFFGTKAEETFNSAYSVQAGETSAGSSSPATVNTLTVSEAGNGTNVLRITRYSGGTALYVTAISITRESGKTASDLAIVSGKETIIIPVGGTYTLTKGTDYSTTSTGLISYLSGSDATASVSSSGVITGEAAGSTTITLTQASDATYLSKSIVYTVTVNAPVSRYENTVTPTGTLDLSDADAMSTMLNGTWHSDYGRALMGNDGSNNYITYSVVGAYSSTGSQTWVGAYSSGSTGQAWDATGVFKGSSAYKMSSAKAATSKSNAGLYSFRVKGTSKVQALVSSRSSSQKVIMAAYAYSESTLAETTTLYVKYGSSNDIGTLTLNLNAATEYLITISADGDATNSRLYEMALFYDESVTWTETITPAKEYTTYVTPIALDFTGLELKAYVATAASSSSVTLEEVTTVPSGTPLILKKASAASYDVPVAASASAPASNLLVAGDGTTSIGGEGKYDYVLKDGAFYHASAGTVAVGKAYLHLDAAPSAPVLSIDFGTTNISTTNFTNDTNISGEYYNLAGQRVANPTKGLYIVNGKKVVIK